MKCCLDCNKPIIKICGCNPNELAADNNFLRAGWQAVSEMNDCLAAENKQLREINEAQAMDAWAHEVYLEKIAAVEAENERLQQENERLQAAAPDLLHAARWALDRLICLYGDEGELSEDLMNAIEKATGERPQYDDCDEYYAADEREVFTGQPQ